MEEIVLKGRVLTPDGFIDGAVHLKDDRIEKVAPGDPGLARDLENRYIVPGYIDLHMHGVHHHLIDKGPEALAEICRILPEYGVTGFLPTVAPRREDEEAPFLNTLANAETTGTEILGFHLEGPFLKLSGSLTAYMAAKATVARAQALINAAKPHRAIFSVSPDLDGAMDIMPLVSANNTPVFMTHTHASVEQAEEAIKLGATHATHFYDVFPFPEVKEPGVRPSGIAEVVLADENISVDFILDGVHVEPIAVKMAMACKKNGKGKVCLITDSNVGAGMEPGRFIFGDNGEIEFAYKGAPARKTEDQTLAGSGLTMDQAVRNAISMLGVDLQEAVTMASLNPAKVIGEDHRKGKILSGYDADITILDNEFNVIQTWVGGKLCYSKQVKLENSI